MIIYMNQTVQLLYSKGTIINQNEGEIKKILIDNEEIFYLKL
jgi:hypothetical protein